MAGSRPNPTLVVPLFPAPQVFTGLSSSRNNTRAGCPCHCGNEILQSFRGPSSHTSLARPPPVGPSQLSFSHRNRRLPDVCLESALQLGALFPEKPAWRLKFISWISRKFPNGMTASFVARTTISPPKSRSKFVSVTNLSASPCAPQVTTSNSPPAFCSQRVWCSPANRSFLFSLLPRVTALIPEI